MAELTQKAKIVVIGSGPCGLGAAWRLQELGHEDFMVLEAGAEAGGLSITATDDNGFLFDMGGWPVPVHAFACESSGAAGLLRGDDERGPSENK